MNIVFFSGLFQTNRIWDKIVEKLQDDDINIIYVNTYEGLQELNEGEEYYAVTISYGYRLYLKYRENYNFKKAIHISPAIKVKSTKYYLLLIEYVLPLLPNYIVHLPFIFNLGKLITGDKLFLNPWKTYKYLKNSKNKDIVIELREDINIFIEKDFYITNEKDKLIDNIYGDISFPAGHNAIYYHKPEIDLVVERIKTCL